MLGPMINLAPLHPQIVHFAIVLCLVGVAFRWLSLTGKVPFSDPAATTLLVLAAVSAVFAVSSGQAAHGPVEAIPGVDAAVRDHEDAGHLARTVLLVIGGLEVVGFILGRLKRPAILKGVQIVSALVGLLGVVTVYHAGQEGGKLVYSYAGGPGLRTGDTADIGRLFTAGLYEQALVDRARHQPQAAAGLIDELARRSPGDTGIELLRIESQLRDRQDAAGALAALNGIHVPANNFRQQIRAGMIAVDAYVALGRSDSARAVLQRLITQFPMFQRLKDRLAQLGG